MSRSLAVVEQGAQLALDGDCLAVAMGGRPVRRVRLQDVEQVLCFGAIELSAAARAALLRWGVDVAFLTRRGQYRGRLVGPAHAHVERRLAQYACSLDPVRSLAIARGMLAGKILNQRNLLLRAQRTLADADLARALAGMRRLIGRLDETGTADALLGLEGQAAALYFGQLGKLLKNPEFAFERRSRRPPRDPVNACLSFGYALLATVVAGELQRVGLDPAVGMLHRPAYGRPSAVLDLMEEFRPVVVDSLTLRLVNRRQIGPDDFGPPPGDVNASLDDDGPWDAAVEDGGGEDGVAEVADGKVDDGAIEGVGPAVYLRDAGRRIFIGAFHKRLRERIEYAQGQGSFELGEILRRQAYALARCVTEGVAYIPFAPR